MIRLSLALLSVLASTSFALPQTAHAQATTQAEQAPVAMNGYCAVCLMKAKKWVKGSPEHSVVYDGHTYLFPSAKEAQMFKAAPAEFVPALNGDCIVCYAKMGKRVDGNIEHGVFHDGRVYFFPGAQEKQMFKENPDAFADADLALNGNCAVCLKKAGKTVPGKEEFTAIYNGMRYLFPSDKERQMFLSNPAAFAQPSNRKGSSTKGSSLRGSSTRNSNSQEQVQANLVSVTGRAGCAACEHGVRPLGAKDTLGLAVNTNDRVYVVEDADKLYPTIYNNRFQGGTLTLKGTIIKQQGKFAWVRPTEVETVR